MSLVDTTEPGGDRAVRPTARQGIAAVAATSTLDAVSTVVGLSLAPVLVERNPVARALFERIGVVATVVLVSALAVGIVVATTEGAVRIVRSRSQFRATVRRVAALRAVGYGTPSVVSLVVATNNFALLASHATVPL
ncbi:hypothetical protein G9C85_16395 [Halorubellus sp. JP-L1]|uniref:DUF5658 family protein n=1 Tax=Halorubellus sp. JP-L1 TaxID=2715753 RepID=UPI00140DAEF7|nr:DUF5658 family protein [Halorubellus sp. JP-L1]NHN43198.1 hypothetical protein [Halorubellus sp. JP-L1]